MSLDHLQAELDRLDGEGLRRELRRVDSAQGRELTLDGRRVLNFCSNDYLGLAGHSALAAAAETAVREWGVGAGASRLISGNQALHETLETELAALVGTEAAVLFNSGYHANLGVIPALVGPGDAIYSDRLNHASLIDGCRLSRASVHVFDHADPEHLDSVLSSTAARRRLVVTESVFSMDGDLAPLDAIGETARRNNAMLMVDEAHATGTLGEGGGLCAALGLFPEIRMGTLGKAFGTFGAFVAGSSQLRACLLNRARTLVFTTALPAPIVAAALAATRAVRGTEGAARRGHLGERMKQFAAGLDARGLLEPGAGASPIFPIIVGDPGQAMECSAHLLGQRVFAQGIRPPTVPPGTSRLRFTVMASHTTQDIARALAALDSCGDLGLLARR